MTAPDMRRILLNRKELNRVRQAVAYCIGRGLGELDTKRSLAAAEIIAADLQILIDAYTAMWHNHREREEVLRQAGKWEDEMATAVQACRDRYRATFLSSHPSVEEQ